MCSRIISSACPLITFTILLQTFLTDPAAAGEMTNLRNNPVLQVLDPASNRIFGVFLFCLFLQFIISKRTAVFNILMYYRY